MRATIDSDGGLMIPRQMRDELGLGAGTEVDLRVAHGRLEVTRARVRVEHGPHGLRFVADEAPTLFDDEVRRLIDTSRR